MTHLEEKHYDAINSEFDTVQGVGYNKRKSAKNCAQITEQIAIEFAEWVDDNYYVQINFASNGKNHIWTDGEVEKTTKELFNEFLQSLAPNPGEK